MIYKVLTRSTPSYSSLIQYILNENKTKDKQIFTHNLRSKNTDIKSITKEFLENESYRKHNRKGQVYVNHEIISLNSQDSRKVSPRVLEDLMEKYVALRGPNGVYFGAVHNDTGNPHIHIMVSALEYRTGNSFYIQRNELANLKKELQAYQIETHPELVNSIPKHGAKKEYLTDRAWYAEKKPNRTITKEKLALIVQEAFNKSKTQKEFLLTLANKNLHHYERAGKPTGIVYEDTKFRFSRLGISNEQLLNLTMDITAEKIALNQIQQIRMERDSRNKLKEKPNELEVRQKENEEIDRINRLSLIAVRERKDDILTVFGDKLIGSELALKLEMDLENLEILERELVQQIEGTMGQIEIIPFDDGAVGPTKTINYNEDGIEKTISYNDLYIERSWLDSNGVQYSNESIMEPGDKESLDMMYESMEIENSSQNTNSNSLEDGEPASEISEDLEDDPEENNDAFDSFVSELEDTRDEEIDNSISELEEIRDLEENDPENDIN